MELIKLTDKIQEKIDLLAKGRQELSSRAVAKANASSDYDRQLAVTLISLKNGVEHILDEVSIINPPASTSERIARGLCYKQKLAMELADTLYRNAVIGMSALEAEVNACQSILKYLEEV